MARGGDGRELTSTDNREKNIGGIAADQLRSFVDRIERLDQERRELTADIKEVLAEAKGAGFIPKVIRFLVAERRKDRDAVEQFHREAELYRAALDSNREPDSDL